MVAEPSLEAGKARHGHRYLLAALILFVVFVLLVDACLIGARLLLERAQTGYGGRIYPNVYVLGVPLGGLTPEEAAATLAAASNLGERSPLILYDGEQQWALPWPRAGLGLDTVATAQAAYDVGRSEYSQMERLRALIARHDVAPVLALDPETARRALDAAAAQLAEPAREASLRLEDGRAVGVPGEPGRALDVDATLANLVAAAGGGESSLRVQLAFRPVPPRVADPAPLVAQAEGYLARRLDLSAYDVLADRTFGWSLDGGTIITWMHDGAAQDGSPRLEADPAAVQDTLEGLAAQMGEGRGFRWEEAAAQVTAALETGSPAVALYVTHPEGRYAVQSGDTLNKIAFRLGVPPGLLAEANPGLDPNWLTVGQELVVPSPDAMLPNMPVPGKRIVISIAEQRMRVYENRALRWDWPVSTGIDSSPTLPGTFQVLNKVDKAYASNWDLWMPNFLAVYRAGPDFYNGIHALPILSSGARLWEGLLGRPASFGCIILGIDEAQTLYDWVEIGVPVIIER